MKIIHETFDAIKAFEKNFEESKPFRDNMKIVNESGTMELEATHDEIEDYLRRSGIDVDDVVPDWLMRELLEHFRFEGALSDDYVFVCK